MAEKIDEFPVAPRPPLRSYPWDEWTDGGTWVLISGVDYSQETDHFRNRMYAQARDRGLGVRTHKVTEEGEPEKLVIQFYGHDG